MLRQGLEFGHIPDIVFCGYGPALLAGLITVNASSCGGVFGGIGPFITSPTGYQAELVHLRDSENGLRTVPAVKNRFGYSKMAKAATISLNVLGYLCGWPPTLTFDWVWVFNPAVTIAMIATTANQNEQKNVEPTVMRQLMKAIMRIMMVEIMLLLAGADD